MDQNYLKELMLKRFDINIVKEALVLDVRNLEDRLEDQRDNWHILVLVTELPASQKKQKQFKLQVKDKPRMHLKHLAHHTLSQIAYIDN